jgi:hypothetical protein
VIGRSINIGKSGHQGCFYHRATATRDLNVTCRLQWLIEKVIVLGKVHLTKFQKHRNHLKCSFDPGSDESLRLRPRSLSSKTKVDLECGSISLVQDICCPFISVSDKSPSHS